MMVNLGNAQSSPTRRPQAAARIASWSTYCLCAAGLLLSSTVGCSDPDRDKRGEVSGTVMLDGKPVSKGEIRFIPSGSNSGPTSGGDIVNGTFHIGYKVGPAVGENQVQFGGSTEGSKKVMIKGRERNEFVDVFPAKYHMNSPVSRTIKPGKNELDFDLKSE